MPTMLRALPHGIVGIVLVLAAAMAFTGRVREEMRDFEVYWTAGGEQRQGSRCTAPATDTTDLNTCLRLPWLFRPWPGSR